MFLVLMFLVFELKQGIAVYRLSIIIKTVLVNIKHIDAYFAGIIYAITALGVGGGYISGGQFLTLYVDFNIVDK